MRTKFGKRVSPRLVVFAGIMALALSMALTASAESTTRHFNFDLDVVIGGTKVPAGDYTLVIDDSHLTVKAGKKVVAQAASHWEARGDKPDRNSVLYGDDNNVIEIRFANQRGVLIVGAP